MTEQSMSHKQLARLVWTRLAGMIPVLLFVFLLPAGTWAYWQAWLYLAVLLIPMLFVFAHLLKHDPELLERRMRTGEQQTTQKKVIRLSWLWFLLVFVLPGLDRRWGWSNVPVVVVLVADLFILLGYGLFVRVLKENSYAARTVAVDEGQQVIDTGPYAIVRHPMYVAVVLMYTLSPLALGSYWALIPAVFIVPLLVARIINEEVVLTDELPGYAAYKERTRYRLIPGIW